MDPQQAKNRLMAECSRKEISTGQARALLAKWLDTDTNAKAVKEIINSLVKDKYIDDSRFAKAYTRDKLRFSKWGPEKIMTGLSDAGIDKAIAEQTVKDEEHLSLQILSDLLSKKKAELEKKQEKKIAETKKQIELLNEKLGDIETQKERAALQRKIYTLQTKIRTSNQQIRAALMTFAARKGFSISQISLATRDF
ncbi:MAG: RecX family transcriptional regulator [Bacteroidales bacterium]|nr:RecX family transcriptional regulator [Bacteroidales bacterium]